MIEKAIIEKNIKENAIQDFISKELPKACYSRIDLKKTPLGEKIIIYTSRPGLVVGKKGSNIQKITEILKKYLWSNSASKIKDVYLSLLEKKNKQALA